MLFFLSARLRQWLLFTLVLPLAGRLLEALGARLAHRNARAGQLLLQAGGLARRPASHRQRRQLRRHLRRR